MQTTDSRVQRSPSLGSWFGRKGLPRHRRSGPHRDESHFELQTSNGLHFLRSVEREKRADLDDQRGARAIRPRRPVQAVLKRVLDLTGSVVGLILLAPLLSGAAMAIYATNPGPVLFRQKRYGLNGKLTTVYKFRSMRICDADETGVRQTVSDDPRVTKVGAFLRKTSIDELPQLLNVLRGEMSLVGPRPHVPNMLANGVRYEDFDPRYMQRCAVRPGITGLAQVKGFRGPTDDKYSARMRLEYDLEYIRTQSFMLDLRLILATLKSEFLNGTGY